MMMMMLLLLLCPRCSFSLGCSVGVGYRYRYRYRLIINTYNNIMNPCCKYCNIVGITTSSWGWLGRGLAGCMRGRILITLLTPIPRFRYGGLARSTDRQMLKHEPLSVIIPPVSRVALLLHVE